MVARGWVAGCWQEMGTVKGKDFFLGRRKCSKIDGGDGCTTLNILKTIELSILNW